MNKYLIDIAPNSKVSLCIPHNNGRVISFSISAICALRDM